MRILKLVCGCGSVVPVAPVALTSAPFTGPLDSNWKTDLFMRVLFSHAVFTHRCQHVLPPLSHVHVLLYFLYWLIDYSLTFLLLVSSSSPPLSTGSFFPSHFLPCSLSRPDPTFSPRLRRISSYHLVHVLHFTSMKHLADSRVPSHPEARALLSFCVLSPFFSRRASPSRDVAVKLSFTKKITTLKVRNVENLDSTPAG